MIASENYWPFKIEHYSNGKRMWIYLHEVEPSVRAFLEETKAIKVHTKKRKTLLKITFWTCYLVHLMEKINMFSMCSTYHLDLVNGVVLNVYC